jgi:hypothetical protein
LNAKADTNRLAGAAAALAAGQPAGKFELYILPKFATSNMQDCICKMHYFQLETPILKVSSFHDIDISISLDISFPRY